jgi:putative SOS response-associated peptidase YedK
MCYSVVVEQDLKKLQQLLHAEPEREAFARYEAMSERDSKKFKPLAEHARIYPGYFAPIALIHKGRRILVPMRYRIRPYGSDQEIPAKYNLFNARLDSLTTRRSWRNLFMKQHGILVFSKFYEWVTDENGKKKIIGFNSKKGEEVLYAPALYDRWIAPDPATADSFASFAIITSDPPPSVQAAGHDRCPIILKEDEIDFWLHPEKTTQEAMLDFLHRPIGQEFVPLAAAG